ncbi:MAG: SMI1/KNR4 family protein [Azonexus sp.]|jgi:hypothetical protein|uniref:SMI1/KNR4 family protein n=1 Tax=Azonexus sp. TaxID=1872668 RepID=UPI00282A7AD1|nr:SMI1/KNR4 family protein [Azonexus sp.]MDR0777518.1 SMI1/KNR4 family protein [Azonexus sp.]
MVAMAFPTTKSAIEVAERELGIRLPGEFQVRLMARNGGELSTAGDTWQVFPVADTGKQKMPGHPVGDMVLENQQARARKGFPSGAVAIAANRKGNLLLLLPEKSSGQLGPQVFVWDHETHKCTPSALSYED